MAGKKKQGKNLTGGVQGSLGNVTDYRHDEATRKNNPPAKIAAEGTIPLMPKIRYEYSPRLAPALRFDSTGQADRLPELLQKAQRQPLTATEARLLADALRNQEPWLEWANKREKRWFDVDPVALHIHERVSPQAILRVAARQDIEPSLFGDPQQSYHDAVQFYQHEIPWTNRLILGDSLQAMTSLSRREDLAGKVQMIFMDPPYGIRYGSNFQPEVGKRDVKDKEQDLTREPEMVKAYRDTWHLGLHSYLSYLRDRFIVARELISDSGSIFVQIGDENIHKVRDVMDEIFGRWNFVSEIAFATTTGFSADYLANVTDHVLWFAKDAKLLKFTRLYRTKVPGEEGATKVKPLSSIAPEMALAYDREVLAVSDQITAQGAVLSDQTFEMQDGEYKPPVGMHWKTTVPGLGRLRDAGRLRIEGSLPRYLRHFDDFRVFPITDVWLDIGGVQNRTEGKLYAVQTASGVIERCMLMATDPGDLVLDPTCGSGTTAYVAEQWGRRWITADTSRVSIAIARQRLMTAKYDFFRLRDESIGVAGNFKYKTVPHITLKSIAQNQNLDSIFAKYRPALETALTKCNGALSGVTTQLRATLQSKLRRKQKDEGRKAIGEADRRRWELPQDGTGWEHWQVPFDTDSEWPDVLTEAVTAA